MSNSGAALVVVEATGIERRGRITHGCLGLYSDDCEAALARMVAHCRRFGTAMLGIQLAARRTQSLRAASVGRRPAAQTRRRPLGDDCSVRHCVRPWLAAPARNGGRRHGTGARRFRSRRQTCRARGRRCDRAAWGARLSAPWFPVPDLEQAQRCVWRLAGRTHALSARSCASCRAVMPKPMPLGARITGNDWVEGGLPPPTRPPSPAR